MKLFKCIKSSNKFLVDVTEGKLYECENIDEYLVTVVDDFYVNEGMNMEEFKKEGCHCKLPRSYFYEIFEEVK